MNWKLCLKGLLDSDKCSIFPKEHRDPTKLMECAKRIARRNSQNLGDYIKLLRSRFINR